MAIMAATQFSLTLLGDGSATTVSLDLQKTPFNLPGGTAAKFLTKVQLPSGVTSITASGTQGGVSVSGVPSATIANSNMTIVLTFTPDAGTFVGVSGEFLF